VTYFGRTPLHGAAAKDQAVILQILVNNGAHVDHKDCFGASVMDVATEMNSCLCLRQLRIIHLNSRCSSRQQSISSSQSTTRKRANKHNREAGSLERNQSTLSQYSETSSILKKRVQPHASRKHISSSAPVTEIRIKPNALEETESMISNATTGKVRPKQSVSWKDVSAEYWHVVEIPRSIEDTVNVKQVTYALPKTILKFSEVNKSMQEEKERKQERESTAGSRREDRLTPEIRQAMRYTKHK